MEGSKGERKVGFITISFIHSFKKYLFNTYYVLSLVSGVENMDIKSNKILILSSLVGKVYS